MSEERCQLHVIWTMYGNVIKNSLCDLCDIKSVQKGQDKFIDNI